jgi:hypothetical protein
VAHFEGRLGLAQRGAEVDAFQGRFDGEVV